MDKLTKNQYEAHFKAVTERWSQHQRVYTHEKEDLIQLPEEVLDDLIAANKVIPDRAFGFATLVDEIRFGRYWIEKMKKDREDSDKDLSRSLRRERHLLDLIAHVQEEPGNPDNTSAHLVGEVIDHIVEVMTVPVPS